MPVSRDTIIRVLDFYNIVREQPDAHKVVQINHKNKIIKTYSSIAEAAREHDLTWFRVKNNCKGNNVLLNYKFMYLEDYESMNA